MRNIIQFVIVVAIVVTVGCIIVPFVANVRTAAKRIQCASNLRTLNATLGNYYSMHERFPPGTVQKTDLPPEERLSWLVVVWPYIEAGPRLRVTESEPWNSTYNYPPFVGVSKDNEPAHPVGHIKLFQCPSTPQPPDFGEGSVNHYIGIAGVGPDAASRSLGSPGVGFFGYDRMLKVSDISDGTSQTIAVMETFRDAGPWTAGGPATVRGLSESTDSPYLGRSGQWTSNHRTILSLFADGSVRNLSDRIDPTVLEALATIAGGEDVSPDDY
jgi:hypothetical protein